MGALQHHKAAEVAGGAAGDLTVTGIKLGDKLLHVIDTEAAGADLVSEFAITADDTINNVGGTDTTGMDLRVEWESYAGGRWDARLPQPSGLGRSSY